MNNSLCCKTDLNTPEKTQPPVGLLSTQGGQGSSLQLLQSVNSHIISVSISVHSLVLSPSPSPFWVLFYSSYPFKCSFSYYSFPCIFCCLFILLLFLIFILLLLYFFSYSISYGFPSSISPFASSLHLSLFQPWWERAPSNSQSMNSPGSLWYISMLSVFYKIFCFV